MHHLDRASREPESHGPEGSLAGPIDEVVDLGDHVLGVVVGIREEGLHVFASRNAS